MVDVVGTQAGALSAMAEAADRRRPVTIYAVLVALDPESGPSDGARAKARLCPLTSRRVDVSQSLLRLGGLPLTSCWAPVAAD